MAIYNNREVTVISPTRGASTPSTIVIQYKDGSHETVSAGRVQFSQDEKNLLIKSYPSDYNDVTVASDDDLKAVRLGVAPASDPSIKEKAEADVRREKAEEATRKQVDAARKEADERISKELNSTESKPTQNTVTSSPVVQNRQVNSENKSNTPNPAAKAR